MKLFTVVFLIGCAALSSTYTVPGKKVKIADKDFLVKQKQVLELFQHVHQNELFGDLYEKAKAMKFEEFMTSEFTTNIETVKKFSMLYNKGMLPMNHIFSVFNEEHTYELKAIFDVFYYAKNWDMFYKFMLWARFHINEGQFIHAVTTAVIHRKDFEGLEIPAIYEIYPFHFFTADVIQKAHSSKMQGFYNFKKTIPDTYEVIIPANYTGWMIHTSPEQKITYFTEDVGLNAYYYYFNMDYPFWLGGNEFGLKKDRRGELYFFFHQQLLARYYLERLSNGLGKIPEFSFYEPVKTGYYPALRYYNGFDFPSRDNFYYMHNHFHYYEVDLVDDYERRIRDAIDYGFITLPDGTHIDLTKPEAVDYLGNMVQANEDSLNKRYYGFLEFYARILLGSSTEYFGDKTVVPSVLEHFETSMRDPVFYQLFKRIIGYYYQFMDKLPKYKYDDIAFPGLQIDSVTVDKLVTYFDNYYSDITNAVEIEDWDEKDKMTNFVEFGRKSFYDGDEFVIKAKQYRLNHLPFTIKLNVMATKPAKGVVRMFFGPKYDEYGNLYDINANRENFVLFDTFIYDFVSGKNLVTRNSQDFTSYIKDRTTYYELYQWVMKAYNGETEFPLDMTEAHCGFPNRLMLPKGRKGGMTFQFFFIITPYEPPKEEQFTGFNEFISCGIGSGARYIDDLPMGFPFDRKIDETVWFTQNMYYFDAEVFHKTEAEVNAVHV